MTGKSRLDDEQQADLERYLVGTAEDGALAYAEAAGFLFAVAASPEPASGADWLHAVLGEAHFDDEAEGRRVKKALDALLAWIGERADAGSSPLPPGCGPLPAAADNIGAGSPLGQWSRGFSFGHQWLEPAWRDRVPEELEDEFGAAVLALSFFSSEDVAEACRQQTGAGQSMADLAGHMLKLQSQARGTYYELGRAIRHAVSEEKPRRRPPADGQRHH